MLQERRQGAWVDGVPIVSGRIGEAAAVGSLKFYPGQGNARANPSVTRVMGVSYEERQSIDLTHIHYTNLRINNPPAIDGT